jgi:hypothetical protein
MLANFPKWRKLLIGLFSVLLLLVVTGVTIGCCVHQVRPQGMRGNKADAMAQRIMAAVNTSAWKKTGAVRWTFAGSHHHLWDRQRHLAQVKWDDVEVLLHLYSKRSIVRVHGKTITGKRAEELREQAYAYWVNDSFWLNPIDKFFDKNVRREIAEDDDGQSGLLIVFPSGGLTPGDAYLWLVDGKTALPREWRMWVSIIPIGGIATSWQGWQTLSTGAKVATRHKMPLVTLKLENVAGAETLSQLLNDHPDPFGDLDLGTEGDLGTSR